MGRYYTGDIDGKFWFGVQSSDDADNFGVEGEPIYWGEMDEDDPYALAYTFTKDDLENIDEGIKECLNVLSDHKEKIDDFFDKNDNYHDENFSEQIGCTIENVPVLLENYARLKLGLQIKECVEKTGSCSFDAEL